MSVAAEVALLVTVTEKVTCPPGSSTESGEAVLSTVMSGCTTAIRSTNVQTVSWPALMAAPFTPALAAPTLGNVVDAVPLATPLVVQVTLLSCHRLGIDSSTLTAAVPLPEVAKGIWSTEPEPLIVNWLVPPLAAGVVLKTNGVVVSLPASLTMVRKPLPGVTTQSEGSEFGSSDGNEHTLVSRPAPTWLRAIFVWVNVSWG